MSDIIDELGAFYGSDALGDGDFSVCVRGAAEITRLRAKVDAVYSERNRLAAAFARMAFAAGFKAGKGVDPDETKWPVVYVDTPNGQVSWHIAEADQGALEGLPQYNGEWDGKFTARDPAWSVWPAADLVATARRESRKEMAEDVAGWHEARAKEHDAMEREFKTIGQYLAPDAMQSAMRCAEAAIQHRQRAAAIRAAAGEGKP